MQANQFALELAPKPKKPPDPVGDYFHHQHGFSDMKIPYSPLMLTAIRAVLKDGPMSSSDLHYATRDKLRGYGHTIKAGENWPPVDDFAYVSRHAYYLHAKLHVAIEYCDYRHTGEPWRGVVHRLWPISDTLIQERNLSTDGYMGYGWWSYMAKDLLGSPKKQWKRGREPAGMGNHIQAPGGYR